MLPISAPDTLREGDVLHHPAFGFATVQAQDPAGVTLRWENQGTGHPVHVGPAGLASSYRRCAPEGLFARSVRDPEGAHLLLQAEPLAAMALLVAELEEPPTRDDVRDWLVSRGLMGAGRFDAWWSAILPLAEGDPRFQVRRGHLGLRSGITLADLARPWPAPLPPPGSLPAAAARRFALAAARGLAKVHASGDGIVPSRDAVELLGDGLRFKTRGAPTAQGRRDDVRFVVRLVLEQVAGLLPSPQDVAEADLVPVLAGIVPDLGPELLAVAVEALGEEAALRPADGVALLERLSVAEAVATLRAALGHIPGAHATAGFNTHIGIVKSVSSQTNQDAFLLVGEPAHALVAVCDGISQSTAGTGDLASSIVVRALRQHWQEHGAGLVDAPPARVHAWLDQALDRANTCVCETALLLCEGDLERHIPMGSTALLAVTVGNRVHLAALGDSRAYLVGRHGAATLAADQNVLALHLREHLAGEPVGWEDGDHALVGYCGHFDLDGRAALPTVFHRTVDLLPGEWLLLCTDGLSDYAAPGEAGVARLLSQVVAETRGATPSQTAMEICRKLVDAANRGGGGDNVTVIAFTLNAEYGPPRPAPPVSFVR